MFNKKQKIGILAALLIALFVFLNVVFYLGDQKALQKTPEWGITFSSPYAQRMGLDAERVYLAILDDLRVDNLRLPVYWDRIEPVKDKFDFEELDWQIEEASKRNVDISLVMGRRVPRWPECWEPDWTRSLREEDVKQEILEMMEGVINRYRNKEVIKYWQVENEPLLDVFGECPPGDFEFLKREISLVKSLDQRPIIITESGELSTWLQGSKLADILGVSMYRVVWNKNFGYFKWFLPPAYYRLKASLVGRSSDKIFDTELQLEPWAPRGKLWQTPLDEQYKSMDINQFIENIDFAKRTGFTKHYLWGAEWWYWMKEARGIDIFWEEAKKLW